MKKQRILTLSCLLFSVLFILSACSNSQTETKNSESTSQTVQAKVNERYQNALSYLESGENKQAYDELNKIKNIKQAPARVRELKADLASLLAAKKAVTAAKLTEAEKYLAQLEKVGSPTALVKQVNELEKEYQAVKLAKHYADEVEQYYQAGAYQAAGGSLQALDSLSSKYQAVAMLQEKEGGYKAKLASAQATTIMAKNDIDTLEKLEFYIDLLDKQMNELLAQRKYLYSRFYKEKNLIAKAKLSKEAKALTPDIKKLRNQIESLDYIRKRSSKYKEYNKQLEQKRNMYKQRA